MQRNGSEVGRIPDVKRRDADLETERNQLVHPFYLSDKTQRPALIGVFLLVVKRTELHNAETSSSAPTS